MKIHPVFVGSLLLLLPVGLWAQLEGQSGDGCTPGKLAQMGISSIAMDKDGASMHLKGSVGEEAADIWYDGRWISPDRGRFLVQTKKGSQSVMFLATRCDLLDLKTVLERQTGDRWEDPRGGLQRLLAAVERALTAGEQAGSSGPDGEVGIQDTVDAPFWCVRNVLAHKGPMSFRAKEAIALCGGTSSMGAPLQCFLKAYEENWRYADALVLCGGASSVHGPFQCFQNVTQTTRAREALALCGGAPGSQVPLACFEKAYHHRSNVGFNSKGALVLCGGAESVDGPLGCVEKALALRGNVSLDLKGALALCSGAASVDGPLTCLNRALSRGWRMRHAVELCGKGSDWLEEEEEEDDNKREERRRREEEEIKRRIGALP